MRSRTLSHSSVKSIDSCGGTGSQGRSLTRHLTPSCKALLTRHGTASAAAPASEQDADSKHCLVHVQAFQESLSKSAETVLEGSKRRRDTLGISEMHPCYRAPLERTEWSCMPPVSDSLGLASLYTDTQCPWEQSGDTLTLQRRREQAAPVL